MQRLQVPHRIDDPVGRWSRAGRRAEQLDAVAGGGVPEGGGIDRPEIGQPPLPRRDANFRGEALEPHYLALVLHRRWSEPEFRRWLAAAMRHALPPG